MYLFIQEYYALPSRLNMPSDKTIILITGKLLEGIYENQVLI